MNDIYPRFEELGIKPNYLWIGLLYEPGACDMSAPLATARSQATIRDYPPKRVHVTGKGTGRTYASQYVGVARVKGRWVGTWGSRGAQQGPRRPLTPEGEQQAAQDRAQALGLAWLERRDGTKEAL